MNQWMGWRGKEVLCMLLVEEKGAENNCLEVSCTTFAFWRRFTHDVDKKEPPPRFEPGLQRLPRSLSAKWNQTAKTEQHSWYINRARERESGGSEGGGQDRARSILQHFVLISHFWKVAAATWTGFWCCPDAGSDVAVDVDIDTGSCYLASEDKQPMLHVPSCMLQALSWYSALRILCI